MKLKTIFVVLLGLALAFSSVAWGMSGDRGAPRQGQPGPDGHRGLPGLGLLGALDLDETQKSEIDSIREAYQSQFEDLHTQMMTSRHDIVAILFADTIDEESLSTAYDNAADNMASIALLQKDMIIEIKSVLTAEQIAEVQELLQEQIEPSE